MKKSKKIRYFIFSIYFIVSSIGFVEAKNKTITDVNRNDYLSDIIYWSVDKNIFKPIDTKFKRYQAVTKGEFEKALSVLRCKPYFMKVLKGRSNDQFVKKSEMVRELSFVITANMKRDNNRLILPDGWRNIYFKDMDSTDSYFKASQILVSLGVIELKNGYFGIPPKNTADLGDKNPGILRGNFLEVLEKSFDLNKCGFEIKLDADGDGVENVKDACPAIPGKGKDGCPAIILRNRIDLMDNFIHIYPGEGVFSAGVKFIEEIDIRIGDEIFAAILNPRTHDLITRSKSYLVEY